MFTDKIKRQQFISTYVVFIINGMLALSIGSIMPYLAEDRNLSYVLCGTLVSLHSIGNFLSSFFAGAFAVKLGRKKSILIFDACFAISYIMILFCSNNIMLMIAFTMTGLARGANSNFCNAIINGIAPGKPGPLNGLHAMFSVGAFTFPLLLMAIVKAGADKWILACAFMICMGVISWLLYLTIPIDASLEAKSSEKGVSNNGFFKEPLFYLTIFTLFFYLCAEQGVIGWLVTYFKDTGLLDASLSQFMASLQWIMILIGRLSVAFISTRVDKKKILPVMGLGLVVFYLLLVNATTTPVIVVGIAGFGLFMAGIYPTTVSFSGNLIKKYPMAWSYILTFASLGSILMPSVIGAIADKMGILTGMKSVAGVVVLDLIFILSLCAYTKKTENKAQ